MKFKALATLALVGCIDAPDTATERQELNGDSWKTIDDYNTPSGQGAGAADVAIRGNAKVIVVGGQADTGGVSSWTVRSSTTGASFGLDATYPAPPGMAAEAQRIAIDSRLRVFVSGYAQDANGQYHWITRMSRTGAPPYKIVDDQIEPPGGSIWISGIAISNDRVIVLAYESAGNTVNNRLRASIDGSSWTELPVPAGVTLSALCKTDLGLTATGSDGVNWVTTVTQDLWSWNTVDVVPPIGSDPAWGTTCGQANGSIYVGGMSPDPIKGAWVVREGTAGGTAWSTVDVVTGPWVTAPLAIGPGKLGRVYVAGELSSAAWSPVWHTRRLDSGAWIDSDDYTSGTDSCAMAYAYSPALGAYAVGFSGNDWIVRLLQ